MFRPPGESGTNFAEQTWKFISFPDDDVVAMEFILKVVHDPSIAVSEPAMPAVLSSMARISDKYGLGVEVRNWAKATWQMLFDNLLLDSTPLKSNNDVIDTFNMAYIFQIKDAFRKATACVGRRSSLNQEGNLSLGNHALDTSLIPDISGQHSIWPQWVGFTVHVSANIVAARFRSLRIETISNLLGYVFSTLDIYSAGRAISCKKRDPGCDAITSGSLLRGLRSAGIPLCGVPPPEQVWEISFEDPKTSVDGLYNALRDIRFHEYWGQVHEVAGWEFGQADHIQCNLGKRHRQFLDDIVAKTDLKLERLATDLLADSQA
ncbi:MAG: hypothetical protein M1820_006036 [Bogoriella megaspora]|nr:MAG: hypothetical protein M1820_006036 [Bogoriella megaspora]